MATSTHFNSRAPILAVVICTRDRPSALLETLDSIWSQTRLPDELIVVDDGTLPERVERQIAGQCQSLSIRFQLQRIPLPGLTRARNHAAAVAQSDILLYLDDDVTCDRNVIAEIVEPLRDPCVAGMTASVVEPAFTSLSARLYQCGYRLAGWWCIKPRRRPVGPRPAILQRPEIAVQARWLSGAAMALRRDMVRANRFDECLADYALGEDREMGYRLAPSHWLLEARQARVVHRRDNSQRPDHRRLGFMTSYNYLYILRKTCTLGPGDWLLVGWSLCVLAAMHLAWMIVGDRAAHWAELRGMIGGVRRTLAACSTRPKPGTKRRGGSAVAETASASHSIEAVGPEIPIPPGFRAGADSVGHSGCERDKSVFAKAQARARERFRGKGFPRWWVRESAFGGLARAILAPGMLAPDSHTPSKRFNSPCRVLFVTNRLEPGGAERMLLGLVKHMPRDRVEPYVLCLKDAGPLAPECRASGVPVFEGLLRFKTDAAVIPRIQRIIAEHDIDILAVAHSGGDRMFWGTLAAGLSEIPVVVWSHWFPIATQPHFERANRALYRWVDTFVALGDRHRRALIRHEHVPAGRITVIPNAIDLSAFMHSVPRREARRRLRLEDSHVGVAIIANLRREKRHDVFIKAARRLAAGNPSLRFLIIGDGLHRDAVQAAAAASGLDHETLRLLGPRDDVPVLLSGLDICCLCSEVECFSVSMLEAAASGCAFIGPDVGCLPEFLEHRRNGLLLEPANPDALADAINELADDAALRRALAEEARKRVIRGHSLEKMASAFADLFNGLKHKGWLRRGRPRRADVSEPQGEVAVASSS